MGKEVTRVRQRPAAAGLSSAQTVFDPLTRQLIEELQAAVQTLFQQMPTSTPVSDFVARFNVLTSGEMAGNKIRLKGRQMGFVNGKLEAFSVERLISELVITQMLDSRTINNITNLTGVDSGTGSTYYVGGWVTE